MNLMKLESQLREVEAEILNCYDINTGEELEDPALLEERAMVLYNAVIAKQDHYARILKDGFFKRISDKIDEKIKSLKREKDDLKFREERIMQVLHERAMDVGYLTVSNEEGKPELYVSPSLSVRRSVDINKVEPILLRYKVPEFTFNELEYLKSICGSHHVLDKLQDASPTCNVTDLPEGHSAINATIRPTVKMTIRKPKDETKKDTVHS